MTRSQSKIIDLTTELLDSLIASDPRVAELLDSTSVCDGQTLTGLGLVGMVLAELTEGHSLLAVREQDGTLAGVVSKKPSQKQSGPNESGTAAC